MDFLEKICYTRKNNIGINNIFWGRGKNPGGYYYQSFAQKGVGTKYIDYDYSPTQ
jgi:hypothetical protein